MSSRNGSFASKVDRMVIPKPTTPMERAKAGPQKPKSKPRGPKSPESSRSAFSDKAPNRLAEKARKVRSQFAPAPARALQPRGMGEQGVNWQAHIKRANAAREQEKSAKQKATLPPSKMAEKAKKAARNIRTASPSFDKGQSPSR